MMRKHNHAASSLTAFEVSAFDACTGSPIWLYLFWSLKDREASFIFYLPFFFLRLPRPSANYIALHCLVGYRVFAPYLSIAARSVRIYPNVSSAFCCL